MGNVFLPTYPMCDPPNIWWERLRWNYILDDEDKEQDFHENMKSWKDQFEQPETNGEYSRFKVFTKTEGKIETEDKITALCFAVEGKSPPFFVFSYENGVKINLKKIKQKALRKEAEHLLLHFCKFEKSFIDPLFAPELVWQDFNPFTSWQVDTRDLYFKNSSRKMFVIDEATKRVYLNEKFKTDLWKCIAVFFTASIVHSLMIIATIVSPIWFLIRKNAELNKVNLFFKIAFDGFKTHPCRVITRLVMPILLPLGMLIATCSGKLKSVRKIFSNIERIGYVNDSPLAPCFRPNPKYHLISGPITSDTEEGVA